MSNLLSIYEFGKVLGLHPLHLMGVDTPGIDNGAASVCVHPLKQYSWQGSDGVSREELKLAIEEAETDITDVLGYAPLATWAVDERVEIPQPPDSWLRQMRDIRGDLFSVETQRKMVVSGGRRSKTLIQAGRPVVYTDVDGDGYAETAEVTVTTTVTDVEEIALYYPDASDPGNDDWQIRPLLSVSISAGTATIKFRREQAVLKSLYERIDAPAINGLTDANFLTTVDVYRVYHDPNVQGQLVWRAVDLCDCLGLDSCGSCGLTIQNACMTVKNKNLGLVTLSPAEWDSDESEFTSAEPAVCGRRPDYVRLWYRAGYIDRSLARPNTTMARKWQLAVAKLAVSKLDRVICSCQAVSDVQSHWSADLRRSSSVRGGSSTYKVTPYELENCPFGTTIAGMDVWRLTRREGLGL